MEIKLGSKVRDKVTGFEGIATAKIEYINKCVQYCVKPPIDKDGKMVDGEYIDVEQLEIVDTEMIEINAQATGGPQRDCPKRDRI